MGESEVVDWPTCGQCAEPRCAHANAPMLTSPYQLAQAAPRCPPLVPDRTLLIRIACARLPFGCAQKEIHEQPDSIFQTMRGRVKMGLQVGRRGTTDIKGRLGGWVVGRAAGGSGWAGNDVEPPYLQPRCAVLVVLEEAMHGPC